MNLKTPEWRGFLQEDEATETLRAHTDLLSDFARSVVKLRFDFEQHSDPTSIERVFGSGTVVAPNLVLTCR